MYLHGETFSSFVFHVKVSFIKAMSFHTKEKIQEVNVS